MPKFTFSRLAIISEVYEVSAGSEEEARDKLFDGCCDPVNTEWVDWHDDNFALDDVEDELVTFLHSKDPTGCRVG